MHVLYSLKGLYNFQAWKMTIVTATDIMREVSFNFPNLDAIRRLVKWQHGYSHEQKQGYERERRS